MDFTVGRRGKGEGDSFEVIFFKMRVDLQIYGSLQFMYIHNYSDYA